MEKNEGVVQESIFKDFVGKYSLPKTLRFELRPLWNTQQMLDDVKYPTVEYDRVRQQKYETVKPWFDELHRDFIKDSLEKFKFDNLKDYQQALVAWEKDRKSKAKKDELEKSEDSLRKEIVEFFDTTADLWLSRDEYKDLGLKKSGTGILFEAGVFDLLKKKFSNRENVMIGGKNIFDDWDKWTGYFKKFFETRKNFYKSDNTSTAVAYRIVNQNLRRFCSNLEVFESVKKKIANITEVEKNFGVSCASVFSLENYNSCLLQEGIDVYNKIIGGELQKDNPQKKDQKLRGLNELINKYRQDNPDEKIPFFKMLDKQILSEKENFIDFIKDDNELIDRLKKFYQESEKRLKDFKKIVETIVGDQTGYDINKIFFSKEALQRNGGRWFANYEQFEHNLFSVISDKQTKQEYETLKTHKEDAKIEEKNGSFSFPDFIRISHIKQALDKQEGQIWKEKYLEQIINLDKIENKAIQFFTVLKYEIEQKFYSVTTDETSGSKVENGYEIYKKCIAEIIEEKNEIKQKEKVAIKNFADATLSIYQLSKYFALEKRRGWLDNYELDNKFYNASDFGFFPNVYQGAYEEIVRPYNLFRNYLTKKPYSTSKWPLFFGSQTLANGWDKNKEIYNSTVILKKDGYFVLGLMHEKHKDLFIDKNISELNIIDSNCFEKMVYKYFPNPSQMIPKCSTQLKEVKEHFKNSDSDYELYDQESFIKPLVITKKIFELNNYEYQKTYLKSVNGGPVDQTKRVKADSQKTSQVKLFQKETLDLTSNKTAYRDALDTWIDFCKLFLESYRSTATSDFDFSHIKDSKEYDSVDEFYRDVEKGSYKITWIPISDEYLKKNNLDGKLFLFKIYNKDWGAGPKDKNITRTKNLHSLYFEQLFSKDNSDKNFIFKLNGEAELFFRPKPNEQKLGYKKFDQQTKKWVKSEDKEEIVDHKRYFKDKILFHCPITLNRVSENANKYAIDAQVREKISKHPEMNIIGLDRGEKHLIYYSVINQQGVILDMGSFNSIGKDGQKNPVHYAEKLETRAKERENARRDWKDIEAIKDLKAGFGSQVVHAIAELVIKHNAFVVFEDLNMRFKQIHGGIEKSVYQQIEKALMDKLSFLVQKGEKNSEEAGHLLKAFQLTAPFESFKDMGKQTGIIFYTQAGYTSKTCPSCGFRRNVKFEALSIEQSRRLVNSLDSLIFDKTKDCFILTYSLQKLLTKEKKKDKKAQNQLYSSTAAKNTFTLSTEGGLRYKWYERRKSKTYSVASGTRELPNETKKGLIAEFNISAYIKGLLEAEKISYEDGNILERISGMSLGLQFYKNFFYAFFLLTETRQTISGTAVDYIHCPECRFDSRHGFQKFTDFSGDANGAYNIARKGYMIVEKIRQFKKDRHDLRKMEWGDLSISIEEWDKYSQIMNKENND